MFDRKLLVLLLLCTLIVSPLAALADGEAPDLSPATQQESLTLPGLEGEVTIQYDQYDIPHVSATSLHDLYMAQGWLHADNRWWQMEWSRRYAGGRLSELMGESYVSTDTFFRTLGLNRNAEQDLAAMPAETLAILDAYAAGVNAWLADKAPADAAIEYTYLAKMGNEVTAIEAWEPVDSVLWGQAMMLGQESSDIESELVKQGIIDAAGQLGAILLLPPYDFENMPLISEPGWTPPTSSADQASESFAAAALPPFASANIADLAVPGIGSNSWVVGGEWTESGLPLVANDPHIGMSNPAVWYEIGLHCEPCGVDAYGFSLASVPAVLIGHNAHAAWGLTNSGLDTIDLYTLELSPDNPAQYQFDGEWVDAEIVNEVINIAGSDPLELPVRITHFGPIISDALGFDVPMAVRAAVSEPAHMVEMMVGLTTITNPDEFQAVMAKPHGAGINLVYGDVDGNIGVVSSGRFPLRAEGSDGSMPMPGIDATYDWQGFLDPMENPRLFNPESGYIVAANNAFLDHADFPNFYSVFYDYGYRAARIETLIQATQVHNVESMMALQTDTYNPAAALMVPVLLETDFASDTLDEMMPWLAEWDLHDDLDSPQAAFFNAFWLELIPLVFDEIAAAGPSGDSMEIYQLSHMIGKSSPLWINADMDTRDPIVLMETALERALGRLSEKVGEDPAAWRWGDLHIAHFTHSPFGEMLEGEYPALDGELAEMHALFNREIPVPSGITAVNRIGWDVSTYDFLMQGSIPSMRMIVDLGNLDNSRFVIPMGQSGDPTSPHYDDLLPLWASGQYHDHHFSEEAVAAGAVRSLTLQP